MQGLFLIEFSGYWESEPDNYIHLYVNPGTVTFVSTFKRDDNDIATYYRLAILGEDDGFILHKTELTLMSGNADDKN